MAHNKRAKTGVELNPAYSVWLSMKRRCYDPNRSNYIYYGGRGIKVCERWLNSFDNFLDDMGDRPTLKHEIDRLDNDKGYEPGNCRWATHQEQSLNRRMRVDNSSGFRGVYRNGKKWQAQFRMNGSLYHFGTYDDPKEAAQAYALGRDRLCSPS